MHVKFLSALGLIIFSVLSGKGQVIDFYKQYGAANDLSLLAIDTTHDGGYISCGTVHNSSGGDYIVIKVDSVGNEVWRRQNHYFNQLDSSNRASCVRELQDHSYIICGYIDYDISPVGLVNQSYIVKLDSLGNVVWEKFLGDTIQESAFDIATYSDNTFITVGQKIYSNPVLILTKFNSQGDSLWRKEISYPGYNVGGSIIKKCFNSDCIVLSALSNSSNGFMRIDSSGSVIDSTIFSYHNTNFYVTLFEYAPYNYYCLLEAIGSPSYTKLIQLDSSLNIISDTNISQLNVAIFSDSNTIYGGQPYIYTLKLNNVGDTIWNNFQNEPLGNPLGITLSRQGCPVSCGNIDDGNNTISIGYILKVCDSALIASASILQNGIAAIYPNPFQNELTIKFNEKWLPNLHSIEVNLYDIRGKLINSYKPNDLYYIIPTDSLTAGMYYLKIFFNGTSIVSNKILIK